MVTVDEKGFIRRAQGWLGYFKEMSEEFVCGYCGLKG